MVPAIGRSRVSLRHDYRCGAPASLWLVARITRRGADRRCRSGRAWRLMALLQQWIAFLWVGDLGSARLLGPGQALVAGLRQVRGPPGECWSQVTGTARIATVIGRRPGVGLRGVISSRRRTIASG